MNFEEKYEYFKQRFFRFKFDYWCLFLVMSAYYGQLQWNSLIGDPDGFYHAKLALLLRQGVLLKNLPWMQYSSITEHFTDHHLLYHLLLVPFTYIETPLIGVKVATVFFAALLGLTFYWLFKKLHIIWPWLWAFLMISLSDLNFRLTLVKVNSLSLIMICLLIYGLYFKKRRLVSILGFLFVWLYGGWPLTILIGAIFLLATSIYDFIQHKKIKLFHQRLIITWEDKNKFITDKKILLFLLGGLLAGVIINPYFPHNLKFYYEQFFLIGVINYGYLFTVGAEWYSTTPMHVMSSGAHFFALGIIAIVILFFNYKKISHLSWFSFFLSFIFFILTIKSKRFVEYYVPFLLIFNASAWTDIVKNIGFKKMKKYWLSLAKWQKIFLLIYSSIFIIVLLPNIYKRILDTKMPTNLTINKYQASANWLKNNTPKDSIIFHEDWDEWPMLFYYDDQNYYLVGLDFSFMYFSHPDLQQLYIKISTGELQKNIAEEIKNNFHSNYIFVEKQNHEKFINNINKDQRIILAYEDQYFLIYKIIY